MMSAPSMGTPKLGVATRVLFPGATNTACLSRSLRACQAHVIRARSSQQACQTLNAQPSSLGRATPGWLPCVRQPMRRRRGITQAALSPSAPAGNDSPVLASLGPFSLTMQDFCRYIAPALVITYLTKTLDGKGILLLAHGLLLAGWALAFKNLISRLADAYLKDISIQEETKSRKWLIGTIGIWAAGVFLIVQRVCQRLVLINVSYPIYSGPVPVLARAASFIKQHPGVAAGCYTAARAMPPLLCFAAVVVVVHRALARIFAGNEPNPATAATMSGTPALAEGVADGASLSDHFAALVAEREQLRVKVDDLAKRLSAVEDYSGDDSANNVLLRRVGEVEGSLDRLKAEVKEDIAAVAMGAEGALASKVAAAESKLAELQEKAFFNGVADKAAAIDAMEALQSRLAAAEFKLVGLQIQASRSDRAMDAAQLLAAAEDKLAELQEQSSGSYTAAAGEAVHSRLAAAEATLAELQKSVYGGPLGEAYEKDMLPHRLSQAEQKIAGFHNALVGTGYDSGELFEVYQEGGLIQKLAAAAGEVAALKEQLAEAAKAATAKGANIELRLADTQQDLAELQDLVGGASSLDVDINNRLERAEGEIQRLDDGRRELQADLDQGLDSAGDELRAAVSTMVMDKENFEARLSEAEDRIDLLEERLGEDGDEYFDDMDAKTRLEDITSSLKGQESQIEDLQKQLGEEEPSHEDVMTRLEDAEDRMQDLKARLGFDSDGSDSDEDSGSQDIVSRLEETECQIQTLNERLGFDSDEDSESEDLVSRLEEAEGQIETLNERLGFDSDEDSESEDLVSRLEETEGQIQTLNERLGKDSDEEYDYEDLVTRLEETEGQIETLYERLGFDTDSEADSDGEDMVTKLENVVSRVVEAEAGITQLNESVATGCIDGFNSLDVMEKLEDTQRRVTDLELQSEVQDATCTNVAQRVETAALDIRGLQVELSGEQDDGGIKQRLVAAEASLKALKDGAGTDLGNSGSLDTSPRPPTPQPSSAASQGDAAWRGPPRYFVRPQRTAAKILEAPRPPCAEDKPTRFVRVDAPRPPCAEDKPTRFVKEDAAASAITAPQPPDSVPATPLPRTEEIPLVKPRPAPEPEAALQPEQPQAWDREGVTPEKIQALKRTLDTRTTIKIPAAPAKTPPKVSEPTAELGAEAAPTSTSLADISRAPLFAEMAADFTKIDITAERAALVPKRWTAGTEDSTVEEDTRASAEQQVLEARFDKPAAAEELAASDKDQESKVEEGGEGEAIEEPAVEAAWDAGLLVAEDWLFDSERIDSFIKGTIPSAKMLANRLTPPSLRLIGEEAAPARDESADSFVVPVERVPTFDSSTEALSAALADMSSDMSYYEAADQELEMSLFPYASVVGLEADVSDDEAEEDDVSDEDVQDAVSDDEVEDDDSDDETEEDDVSDEDVEDDVSDGDSYDVDIDRD